MAETVFQRFSELSQVPVMVGGMLERVLSPEHLDALFERTADRQYTRELLFPTVFETRHHANLPWEPASLLGEEGRIETGLVHQQLVRIVDDQGQTHRWRRITLTLDQPTRDGDHQIIILSSLPLRVSALQIARL